jgi:hypothetical protein
MRQQSQRASQTEIDQTRQRTATKIAPTQEHRKLCDLQAIALDSHSIGPLSGKKNVRG